MCDYKLLNVPFSFPSLAENTMTAIGEVDEMGFASDVNHAGGGAAAVAAARKLVLERGQAVL